MIFGRFWCSYFHKPMLRRTLPSTASEAPDFEEHTLMIRATRSRSIRPNKLQNQIRSPKPPAPVAPVPGRPRFCEFHAFLEPLKTHACGRKPPRTLASGSGPYFAPFWNLQIIRKPSQNGARSAKPRRTHHLIRATSSRSLDR